MIWAGPAVVWFTRLRSCSFDVFSAEALNIAEPPKGFSSPSREAYVEKRCTEAAREGEEKTFGGFAIFGAAPEKKSNEQLRM